MDKQIVLYHLMEQHVQISKACWEKLSSPKGYILYDSIYKTWEEEGSWTVEIKNTSVVTRVGVMGKKWVQGAQGNFIHLSERMQLHP